MTHDEALRTVAADMHAALKAWQEADYAQDACDNWLDEDDTGYEAARNKAMYALRNARRLTSAVNHRIQELFADSVTSVTLNIGDAE